MILSGWSSIAGHKLQVFVIMRITDEDAPKTRRQNLAATAELFNVPKHFRVLSLRDKPYLSFLPARTSSPDPYFNGIG